MGHKEIIDQHRPLAELILQHGYAPSGSGAVVSQLEQIFISIGGKKVDKFCFSCVKNMFSHLYNHYYPTLIKEESNGNKGRKKENRKS